MHSRPVRQARRNAPRNPCLAPRGRQYAWDGPAHTDMDLRPEFIVKTVVKALTDTVLPAVDPANKLAQEQAQLAVAMLGIVLQRLPLMYRYDRDELARNLALADSLREQAARFPGTAEAVHALGTSAAAGEDVMDRSRAEPSELEAANFDLRARIGDLITLIYAHTDIDDLKHISAAVTGHAREQLLRDRAWLIGQGWEPDPKAMPALETLIGNRPVSR